jgi:glycine/D-amino acid oxidase-like deaminating enzyme
LGLLPGLCNACSGCASGLERRHDRRVGRPPAATVEQTGVKVHTRTPIEHLLVCGGHRVEGVRAGAERFRAGHVVLATSLTLRTADAPLMPPDSEAMSAVVPKV